MKKRVGTAAAVVYGLSLFLSPLGQAQPPTPPPPPPPPPAWDCMLPWANPLGRCAGAPRLPCDRVHGGQGIPGVC
ncbi:hypothetical protein [Mycolicibacterium phlei]